MRLSPEQIAVIKAAVAEHFGDDATVTLFGSRVDDSKRGGDIDLLICPSSAAGDELFSRKVRLLAKLERSLGERKIDVVIEAQNDPRPIVSIAHATGVRIG